MTEACERMKEFCAAHHATALSLATADKSSLVKRVKLEQSRTTPPNGHLNGGSSHKIKSNSEVTEANGVVRQDNGSVNNSQKCTTTPTTGNVANGTAANSRDKHAAARNVVEVQAAKLNECVIRDVDALVDEMEHD